MKTYRIEIEGLVQGVGFRPFVYRLASSMGLQGSVENLNSGVRILVNSSNGAPDEFIAGLKAEAPRQAQIETLRCFETEYQLFAGFSIVSSRDLSDDITRISPDIAVCADCLNDLASQEHRRDYPLINCTNCGPRFSIITGVPYDRRKTTMNDFEMCGQCSVEYNDVDDRRFHAQPVACNNCGPVYRMRYNGATLTGTREICTTAARLIDGGGIVAVKGTGGYHLVCDAMNADAVSELRRAKEREGKPFAVMCRDTETVRSIAGLSDGEALALESWHRPVMILEGKGVLPQPVSNRLNTIGVILPYMPFHYLLFRYLLSNVIVFTSANHAEDPVIISDSEAEGLTGRYKASIISYNREIYNRTDDSVGRFIDGEPRLTRRSRGYAPAPVRTRLTTEGIFGAGAELSNCFAIGRGNNVIMSQHIGDLRNAATLEFYETACSRFTEIFRFTPSLVARDIHPDYLSSVFADSWAEYAGLPVCSVQHHHAHIASCMTENMISDEVIGVALDGVGIGTDGRIWGGEIVAAGLTSFRRLLHFEYVPVAGGDRVSGEPWRSGLSWLIKYCPEALDKRDLPLIAGLDESKVAIYTDLLRKGINTNEYSGAGRLFDAVAAITGLDIASTFHAEAPMRLESAVMTGITESYPFAISDGIISFGDTIKAIVSDMTGGRAAGVISAMFHNCVASAIIEAAEEAKSRTGIRVVALSGGTFQNRYLAERVIGGLRIRNFSVIFHRNIPANDGGIALGQVAVAAARREAGLI